MDDFEKKPGRVRPVSRDKSFAKLRSLMCFEEVHQRIVEGYPLREIAQFIQDEKAEYTDVKAESLVWILDNYRNTIPKAQLVAKRMPPVFAKAAEQVRKGLDELEELEKLYHLQVSRIEIDHKNEKNIKKLFPTMPAEIKVAKDILQTISDLKMDLGLSKRHLGQLDVDARVLADVQTRYDKPSVSQVLSNPESRRKLLGIADQFLALQQREDDAIEVEGEEVEDSAEEELDKALEEDK